MLGARQRVPGPHHDGQHHRDHRERRGVQQHRAHRSAPGDDDAAGRRPEQPHHPSADLVPADHRAEVVGGHDLSDDRHPGRDGQPRGHAEGQGDGEQGPRAVVPRPPGDRAEHQHDGPGDLARDQHAARVPAVGDDAADQHQRGLREHLDPEHRPGDRRGEGVHGRPRERHGPHRVAEPRDRDRHQPGEDHRVAPHRRGCGTDQRAHGRTGPLGKQRITVRTCRRTTPGRCCSSASHSSRPVLRARRRAGGAGRPSAPPSR